MTGVPAMAGLGALASSRTDDPAIVVEGGEALTYGAWERRSDALAAGMAGRGVAPGARVALRFDIGAWPSFAVAYAGVAKAGAVPVLIPPGLADADASRAVRHAGAVAVVCPDHLVPRRAPAWAAAPGTLEQEGRGLGAAPRPVDPSSPVELVLPPAPVARLHPLPRTAAEVVATPTLRRPGWLVHTWAPGSLAGQHVLTRALSGAGDGVASPARPSPRSVLALASRLEATTCGLGPGLAAALAAEFGPGSRPPSVTAVVVSPPPGTDTALGTVFPAAALVHLDDVAAPAADLGAAPVGACQLGMVWHEQLAPGSFNLPSLVRRYRGSLDVAALERALSELVRRHEPLRATFEVTAGQPRQVVRPVERFLLDIVDLSGLTAGAQVAAAAELVDEATRLPFDLVDGPLFAPRLVRLGADDHVLVVRLHHTAFDDWSVDVFRRDLSALYTAFAASQSSPLPDLPTRFVDVCRRQRARLDGGAGDEQRAAWRDRMAGAPLAAQLALGEPHELGPDRPGAGEPLRRDLPPDLARRVRAFAPTLRATPFMTVLAAFATLVARRTGLEDLVMASVVAGRGTTDVEPLIGCFTKKVLLRVRLDGDPTFAETVARTRSAVLAALTHQDLPFETVVQDTIGRAAAAHGLAAQVPIVFQGEAPQQARLVLPGVEVGPFDVPPSARRERHFSTPPEHGPRWGDGAYLGTFLLLSLLEEGGRGLALVARGVFSRPAAVALLEEMEGLLAAVTDDPAQRLSQLAAGTPPAAADDDGLTLLGLHLRRSRLEAALAACPGVAEVAVAVETDGGAAPRLAAYVVPAGGAPPTLAQLRRTLWASLPGSPWPAEAVIVGEPPRRADGRLDVAAVASAQPVDQAPDPDAVLLTRLWAEAGGRDVSPATSYWQDFSFLRALVDARAAGLPVTDELVARCRTPEMLAAALPHRA